MLDFSNFGTGLSLERPAWREALNDRLRELAGKTIRVETGPRLEDRFGRLLRYVYTVDGLSIDVLMIGAGLAEASTRDGQHRDTLVWLEEGARQHAVGCLWSNQ